MVQSLCVAYRFFYAFGIEADQCAKLGNGAVLYEVVGQSETCDGGVVAVVGQPFEHGRPEAAGADAVFDGDDVTEMFGHFLKDMVVERLHETHIVVGKAALDAFHVFSYRPYGEHGHVCTFAQTATGSHVDGL